MLKMKILKILMGLIILIFISFNANAFGVAAPFAGDNPVVVLPGETKELDFLIQNGAGATEAVNTKVDVISGSEIVEIDKREYNVPINGEVVAKIRVKVPEYASESDKWSVILQFKTTNPGKSGVVGVGYGVTTQFNVVTKEPITVETESGKIVEGANYTNFLFSIIFVVIVVIIIYLIEKRGKGKRKK